MDIGTQCIDDGAGWMAGEVLMAWITQKIEQYDSFLVIARQEQLERQESRVC